MFTVGLDLGQARDYSALAVLEETAVEVGTRVGAHAQRSPVTGRVERWPERVPVSEPRYAVRHLERFERGTRYPAIVERTRTLLGTDPLQGAALVVDATGVGRPVADLFDAAGLRPVAITITGGNAVTGAGGGLHVPKRDLASTLQVLLQAGHLTIAAGLPEAATLQRELLAFRVKINLATGHDSYEAWREGDHDDLVLAVGLACWYARHGRPAPAEVWRIPGFGGGRGGPAVRLQ